MFPTANRRHFLRVGAVGLGMGVSGWFQQLARAAAEKKNKKACILLWLNGGPSTIDLWDLKPGHENGGPYKEIATESPELKISEHLPKLAKMGKQIAVIRGMSTKEGDHGRASHLLRTGALPMGGIQFPSIGALLSKELGDAANELPNFISIAPQRFFNTDAYGSGFLGPQYAPLVVADNANQQPGQATPNLDQLLKVQNLDRPAEVSKEHAEARLEMLKDMHEEFAARKPGSITSSHQSAYDRATRLMQSDAGKVFDLSQEKDETRDRYGRNLFGQGCLLARRLAEKGVPFVEVNLGNWDTHQNNFDQVKQLSGSLDNGWAALMGDLHDRGLLNDTLIICMGEFGRTPKINQSKGRDHFATAWATVLAGGGIKGGQAVGKTSKDGMSVEDRPTSSIDLMATACQALGVDWKKQNQSNVGRPLAIVDKAAEPITEILV
jgi:hypothetical protein